VLEPLIQHEQGSGPPDDLPEQADNALRLLFIASSRSSSPPPADTHPHTRQARQANASSNPPPLRVRPAAGASMRRSGERAIPHFVSALVQTQTGSEGGADERDTVLIICFLIGVALLSAGIVYGVSLWRRPYHTWPGVAEHIRENKRDRLLTPELNMGGGGDPKPVDDADGEGKKKPSDEGHTAAKDDAGYAED